jgi:hypothetical protein
MFSTPQVGTYPVVWATCEFHAAELLSIMRGPVAKRSVRRLGADSADLRRPLGE